MSLGVLTLMLGPLAAVMAQTPNPNETSNLNEFCSGDGPDAITQALPFLDPPQSGDVPQFCFDVAGRERCFYVMVPPGTIGEVPLVFDIHGGGSCPIFSIASTGWFELAQANKFVIVWPLGVTDAAISDNTCFAFPGGFPFRDLESSSCCCLQPGSFVDAIDSDLTQDAEFLRTSIEAVIANVGSVTDGTVSIDTKKVFMAGHSNGCVASLAMAAMHSDLVTGVACHAGKSVTPFAEDYTPVPTFIVHGLKDIDFTYAEVVLTDGADGIRFASTQDQFKTIADRNACAEDILTTQLPDEEGKVETRTGCTNNADVTLVTLNNAGHNPFLGEESPADPGSLPTTIDTTQLAWDFLSKIGETPTETPTAAPTETPTAAPNGMSSAFAVKAGITTTIMAFFLVGMLF